MKTEDILSRVDQLLELGRKALSTSTNRPYAESGALQEFRAASLSFIGRIYGSTHSHFKEFESKTSGIYIDDVRRGIGILLAIRSEIEGGWLFTLKSLVAAELFSDLLDQADHLLGMGYKDPAGVIAGSVLEEHLRQLCLRDGIEVEVEKNDKTVQKKADRMNADLAKNGTYTKLDQKLVTAWLDLRNKAAHGKHNEYNLEQVRQMLNGITEFMARIPV